MERAPSLTTANPKTPNVIKLLLDLCGSSGEHAYGRYRRYRRFGKTDFLLLSRRKPQQKKPK